MATQKSQSERQPELVVVPWEEIEKIRVREEPDWAGEYVIKGRMGRLRGFDLSGLIAAPKDPGKMQWNPQLISVENGPGKGWTHYLRGHADQPYLFNAVTRRLQNRTQYLLMKREPKGWYVVGNEYGGDIELHTGGCHNSEDGKWREGDMLDYEFRCPFQHYPQCFYHGDIDISPVEDLFTY